MSVIDCGVRGLCRIGVDVLSHQERNSGTDGMLSVTGREKDESSDSISGSIVVLGD